MGSEMCIRDRYISVETGVSTQLSVVSITRRKLRRLSRSTTVAPQVDTYKRNTISGKSDLGCRNRRVHIVWVSISKYEVNVSEQNAVELTIAMTNISHHSTRSTISPKNLLILIVSPTRQTGGHALFVIIRSATRGDRHVHV